MELSPLPVIGLFLSHFDDIKGQCVVYYKAKDEELLPPGQIEHSTLASGLHLLSTDLVLFAHCGFPAAGLFRSRHTGEVGRGRRMGTVGVILGPPATTDTLFSCRELLEGLYDDLEDNSTSLFNDPSTIEKMDAIWRELTSSKASSSTSSLVKQLDSRDEARRIRGLVEGRIKPEAHHPLVYLPSLLSLLGPSIVVVYKAAIAGRRILLYSPPPLVPLSAFAWCIQAMSIPPAGSSAGSSFSTWIGNVGLMDLDSVKQRRGGWIGTTSDSIFRSHQKCYDLFIDLSSPTPANDSKTPVAPDSPLQSRNTPTSLIETDSDPTLLVPNPAGGNAEPISITYSFSDLALYRSLLLLEASPSSITTTSMDRFENGIPTGVMSKKGGMWLLAFELYERLYKLCVGVCEFATGRGYTSDPDHPTLGGGAIRLGDGEEDARLLDLEDVEDPDGSVAQPETTISQPGHTEEDEAVRIGILMLRQLHHHTYHLHHKLKTVRKSLHGAELTQDELKELIGKKITWGGDLRQSIQGKWWIDLARTWDVVVTGDEDE